MSDAASERVEVAPRRLLDGDDATGQLLRGALGAPLREPAIGFGQIARVRHRRVARKWAALGVAAASASLAAIALVAPTQSEPAITAEAQRPSVIPAQHPSAPGAHPPTSVDATEAARPVDPRSQPLKRTAPPMSEPEPRREPSEAGNQVCRGFVQRGDYRGAVTCYDEQAQGQGLGAELALLEKARIQQRALREPAAGLATLDEYARRFPDGALRREAAVARIDSLARLGRAAEAEAAIDASLAAERAPEQRGELLLLRAQLRSEAGDCAEAAGDLEEARESGISEERARPVAQACGRAAPTP